MNRRVLGLILVLLIVGAIIAVLLASQTGPVTPTATPTDVEVTSSPTSEDTAVTLTLEPGNTIITLSWNAMDGASAYNIYRDGADTPLNPTPLTEPMYQDIGLTNGRTYRYQIAVINDDGSLGPLSAPADAAPRPNA